ncbi:hypothetical protein TUBRATIS_008120 [Tubulinosema ratisbonensis]|uniref:Uncharacterized protein n=1 Tax=Tubulinosema ratisbonensis TaxID=291195 RepID=A0A437ANV5_9MICR|nr:hypothetical protein TUBRATIS_008120 [Tubulinosema ratisbonensis]
MSELPAEQTSKQEVLIPEQAGMIVNPEQENLESESKFFPSHPKKQIKSKVNALKEEQEIEQRKEIPSSFTEKTSSLSKNYEFTPSLEGIEAEAQKEEQQQSPLLQVENVRRTINVPREVINVEPSEVNRKMFEFIPILKEIEAEARKEEQQQLPVSHVENVEKTIYVPNETINVSPEETPKESFVYPSTCEETLHQPLVSEKQKIYSRHPEEKKTKLALEKGYSSDPEEFLSERESEVQPRKLVRRQSFGETPHIMSKLRRNFKK